MSDKTKIEWSDATWNPVTGCTKVSEGCRNCYAMKLAERWRGTKGHYFENGFDITMRPHKLDQPLKWQRPRKIFVNSMSDLFHPDVPFDYIDQVFAVMALAPQHTFQILTKRPGRMREYIGEYGVVELRGYFDYVKVSWPLPNVWLGVSVENQKAADERIPLLLQTPAAVRFLSCEPLLGPVDLEEVPGTYQIEHPSNEGYGIPAIDGIDWVIVGGESGPGARPMHPDWARSLRDQCKAAGVAFFHKQNGEWLEFQEATNPDRVPASTLSKEIYTFEDGTEMIRVGKQAAGRLLDGREWNEFPK